MGKSPGKWIKTLLFGKKSRSHAAKGRDSVKSTDVKGFAGGNGTPALASPVISEPVLVTTNCNVVIPTTEKETPSNLASNAAAVIPGSQNGYGQGVGGSITSEDARSLLEKQAAIKAQAAFRGYLARRAFHALKGIIKLQALGRGHLVRRQAVATLRAMDGIIKLQALARGIKARRSSTGIVAGIRVGQANTGEPKAMDSFRSKSSKNAFVFKLLSSPILVKPLQIQYDQGDPNSVYSWLERWTGTSLWNPLSQPKKLIDSKAQTRRSIYAMETESGKSKRYARRTSAINVDSAQTIAISESEKTKRSMKKVLSSPVESMQEQPQSELEKVKRNLRKISSSTTDAFDQPEVDTEKSNQSFRNITSAPSEIPHEGTEEVSEQTLNDIVLPTEVKLDSKNYPESLIPESNVLSDNRSSNEIQPLQQIDNDSSLKIPEEEVCNENQKNTKRRSSFSAKSEYAENGLPNNPVLPSYMAPTKSAKAKLRGQMPPMFVSDTVDKNGFTRRHSLPSAANGKLVSHSPRTQKLIQTDGTGEFRSDRSLLSSRDANERAIRVEWKR